MAKNNINNSALAKLCSYVVLASQQQGILDNLNIADDKTYSSKHIKDLIDNMSEEDRKYAEKLVKNLNSLSSKKIDEQPTDLNTQPNTMYFWNENGDGTTFKQYLRLDDELLYLGSTADINLDGYLLEVDADGKYLKQVDAHTHNNKLILDTITQAKVDEWDKGGDGLIPVTKAQHNELVTNGSTTINGKVVTYDAEAFYVITDDENSVVDMSKYLTTADKVNMGMIHEGVSLNDLPVSINKASIYYAPSYALNMPVIDDGMVIHMNMLSDQHAIQQYNSLSTNEVYIRVKVVGTWGAWRKLCSTSVADVPSTVVTTTNANLNTSSGYIRYRVKNGICYVSAYNIISSTTGSQIISNSLPTPEDVFLYGGSVTGSANGINTGYMYVEKGVGKLVIEVNTANVAMFGTFSYPVAES